MGTDTGHHSTASAVVVKNAVIKGYHVYKVRPPMSPVTELTIAMEYSNPHDTNATLVWMPGLETFPVPQRSKVTDEKRMLKIEDIAGLPVGHVPIGLSGCFRQLLNDGLFIKAVPTGEPIPSFPPWPAVQEKGGGVVIPCVYTISCSSADAVEIKQKITCAVDLMAESQVLEVNIV